MTSSGIIKEWNADDDPVGTATLVPFGTQRALTRHFNGGRSGKPQSKSLTTKIRKKHDTMLFDVVVIVANVNQSINQSEASARS